MTLTGLAAESPFAGGSGKDSIRRLSAVLVMLAGALAGALLLETSLVIAAGFGRGLSGGHCAALRAGRDPSRQTSDSHGKAAQLSSRLVNGDSA
jgi:hypothetical protein